MMKTFLVLLGSLLLGMIASVLVCTVLFPFWVRLDWEEPMADWLRDLGYSQLAAYWSIVWLHLLEWFVAVALGVILGLLIRRRWFLAGVTCSIGFIVAPDLMMVSFGVHPVQFFGIKMTLLAFLWTLVAIPMLFLGILIGTGIRPAKPPRPGHCTRCGHDLRGLEASIDGICQECGQQIKLDMGIV